MKLGLQQKHGVVILTSFLVFMNSSQAPASADAAPMEKNFDGSYTPVISIAELKDRLQEQTKENEPVSLASMDYPLSRVEEKTENSDLKRRRVMSAAERIETRMLMAELQSLSAMVAAENIAARDEIMRDVAAGASAEAQGIAELSEAMIAVILKKQSLSSSSVKAEKKSQPPSTLVSSLHLSEKNPSVPDMPGAENAGREVRINEMLKDLLQPARNNPLTFLDELRRAVENMRELVAGQIRETRGQMRQGTLLREVLKSSMEDVQAGPTASRMLPPTGSEMSADSAVIDSIELDETLAAAHVFLHPKKKGLSPWYRLVCYYSQVDPSEEERYVRAVAKVRSLSERAKKENLVLRIMGREYSRGIPAFLLLGQNALVELVDKSVKD